MWTFTSFAAGASVCGDSQGIYETNVNLQILGTIVTRSPSCSLAPRALTELDKLCTLLRNARTGVRPSQLLVSLTLSPSPHAVNLLDPFPSFFRSQPHVLKISAKAHAAYDIYHAAPGGSADTNTFDVSAEVSALAGSSRVSPRSSNASSPTAAAQQQQQSPQGGSSSVTQSQSPNTSNSSPPANPAFNSNSPSTYPNPNPISVEPAAPSESLPTEADMNHIFSQANWSSLADFEAFASSFAVEPESQTQAHSQFGTIQNHESNPQQQTGLPVVYPPTVGIDSFDNWPGGVNTMFEHATDQLYPQDETLYPTLEMQPTWQHFMMQMFGNSSAS